MAFRKKNIQPDTIARPKYHKGFFFVMAATEESIMAACRKIRLYP